MIIDLLNYQPIYYLIGIRVIHILLLIPVIYFIKDILKRGSK